MSQADTAPSTGAPTIAGGISASPSASHAVSGRRAFIAGLALAPVAIAAPAMAHGAPIMVCAPANSAWQAALADERKAALASESFYAAHVAPANAAFDAGTASISAVHEQEEAWGEYTSAHADAVNALLLTPAPTLDDVVHKLRMGIRDYAFDGSDQGCKMLEIIASDIERLTGAA